MLEHEARMHVANRLISAGIAVIVFSGGEPTLVPRLPEIVRRFREASVTTKLYTSGFGLDRALAEELAPWLQHFHISLDGITPETHDRIRGRPGAFEHAMRALELVVSLAHETKVRIGVEFTAVKSNFHEIAPFCEALVRRFPTLNFITVGAAIPSGLANRTGYAEAELLATKQLEVLRSTAFTRQLRRAVSTHTTVRVDDNWDLLPANLEAEVPIQVEPDGAVRAFPIYEGTVGSLLHESLDEIWKRARARHRDPFVVELLSKVTTMQDWAAAARMIDARFGSAADLVRIGKRPPWPVGQSDAEPERSK